MTADDATGGKPDSTPDSGLRPDTKDWTWVLERPCPQCGVDAGSLTLAQIPDLLRDNARAWLEVLSRDDVTARRDAGTWSPLEYACHVRDVHALFDERLASILDQDDPTFASWDQHTAAVEGDYGNQVPRQVGVQLAEAAGRVADRYAGVPADQSARTGRRSDGAVFTVTTLAQYQAHEALHHLWDVQE